MAAALGMIGATLCALSPAWGARGYHRVAITLAALGGLLALLGAVSLV